MKITNLNTPVSIGGNKVINETSHIPGNMGGMFTRIPAGCFAYDELAKRDMFLVKTGINSLLFRSADVVKGDKGMTYPEIQLLYTPKKDKLHFGDGAFRGICTNGMIFGVAKRVITFNHLINHKLNRTTFEETIEKLHHNIDYKIRRYANTTIDQDDKINLLNQFIKNISQVKAYKHYKSNYNLESNQVNKLIINPLQNLDMNKVNRSMDNEANWWVAFNTIQENMTKRLSPVLNNSKLSFENKILTKSLEQIFGK